MSTETIIDIAEANTLIAEYMGLEKVNDKYVVENENDTNIEIFGHYSEVEDYLTIEAGLIRLRFSPLELEYHKRWDWIMPVVEKINNTKDDFGYNYNFQIGSGYVWVDQHIGDRIFFSGNTINNRKIPILKKVYRGVIAYIKWYNKNQKK